MADRVLPGPVDGAACIKEAVCIHTRKIMDSCKDKDCIEDLPVFPTENSQAIVLASTSIRPRSAELLGVSLTVDEINFNRGFYTVDVRYYYKVRGEAYPSAREVQGLAVFDKRVILFGGEGSAKVFSSSSATVCGEGNIGRPVAVVEAVDPIVLRTCLLDESCITIPSCTCATESVPTDIPVCVADQFDSEIQVAGNTKVWLVSLGQFSLIRLEREVQLLMPCYDYCVPDKECMGSSEDDPCTLFSRIRFPIEEFYPTDACGCSNDCGCSSSGSCQ